MRVEHGGAQDGWVEVLDECGQIVGWVKGVNGAILSVSAGGCVFAARGLISSTYTVTSEITDAKEREVEGKILATDLEKRRLK